MSTNLNPIAVRDLLIDEPNGAVQTAAIEALIRSGWPVEAILTEVPTVSEGEVRRVLAGMRPAHQAAA